MTNSRQLIRHTVAALKEFESVRLGVGLRRHGNQDSRFSNPIAAEEEQLLETYLSEHNITGENECSFVRETYLGCIRRGPFLEATLQRFLKSASGTFLQKDYYLFAVICYLALWRLEEIGFAAFSRFVRCFEPGKMALLVAYLFNPDNVQGELRTLWCSHLDEHYVREKIIEPMVYHVPNAQQLERELKKLNDNGMELRKVRKVTAVDPFLLTVPKPRSLPQPTVAIPTEIRARPIPKALFETPRDEIVLSQKRAVNKDKAKKLYEQAQEGQFSVARPPSSDKKEALRQKLKQEELAKQVKPWTRPHRSPQAANGSVDVKLTTAAILREESLLQKKRKEQQQMIAAAEMGLQDAIEFEAWKDRLKAKEEEERILELERKRLEVQLLHEETYLARQELVRENKEKVAEVLAEKCELKTIEKEIKMVQALENQKKIEDVHLIKEGATKAKESIAKNKARNAASIMKEKKVLQMQILRQEEEERLRKTKLIQQIRLLELGFAKSKSIPKEVDLTESSGIGLLGEMSVAELQERLVVAKAKEAEASEAKRKEIGQLKEKKALEMCQKLQYIDQERQIRKEKRISKALPERGLSTLSMASDSSDAKELIREKDRHLRSLHAKILEKKRSRLAAAQNPRSVSAMPSSLAEMKHDADEIDRARRDVFTLAS
ncbi:hypothetical protein HDV03_002161 [Kappamyces sp. JEL0829]|nr:hypothetical protein HDV03_002161 [Kappamyces sp. JEL0829]